MKAVEITEKVNNKQKLEYKEIEYMVNSYVKNRITDETMSNFVWAIYNNGLSMDETYYLTDVMIKSGEIIDLSWLSLVATTYKNDPMTVPSIKNIITYNKSIVNSLYHLAIYIKHW